MVVPDDWTQFRQVSGQKPPTSCITNRHLLSNIHRPSTEIRNNPCSFPTQANIPALKLNTLVEIASCNVA